MPPDAAWLRVQVQRGPRAGPWRRWAWAACMAIAVHVGFVSLLSSTTILNTARPIPTGSMQTRLLDAEPLSPPATPALDRLAQPALPVAADRPKAPAAAPGVRTEEAQSQVENPGLALADTRSIAMKIEATRASEPMAATPATTQPAVPSLLYPPSLTMQFEGVFMNRGQERSGAGTLKWATDGLNYELRLQASALIIFNRLETSVGSLAPHGLAPRRYSSSRNGRSEQATHFQYEAATIQFSANKPPQVLLPGAQDRLSVLVQLAAGFAGDPGLAQRAERVVMQVAGTDSAELWEFKLEGRERLSLPAGELDTLKLSRVHRHEYDANLYLWLAPQLGFLPVRILQSARSAAEQDFTDLRLRALP